MHKQWWNHLQLDFLLEPEGGLLIKAGTSPVDPSRPDMSFVRTIHPATNEETVYLPGSSLKGVLRSHGERLIRSALGEEMCWVCNPLLLAGRQRPIPSRALCSSYWRRGAEPDSPAQIYARSCLACRTFGHTRLASRLMAADAFPLQAVGRLPLRQGIGIDRKTGVVADKALYDLEVAPTGTFFRGQLEIHNFELWQVGLLAQVLEDIDAGWVRLGYGKSRGLGRVHLLFTRLRLTYFAVPQDIEIAWRGVAALAPRYREPYRLLETTPNGSRPAVLALALPPTGQIPRPGGVTLRWGEPEAVSWGTDVKSKATALRAAHQAINTVLQTAKKAWKNLIAVPPHAPRICGEEWRP